MSTLTVSLPVVSGGVGAGQDTSLLATKKTLVVTDVSGSVSVEVSDDDVNYCAVATFSNPKGSVVVDAVAKYMRVNASGSASSAFVMAEQTTNMFAQIPSPPANGPGASLDITNFGCKTTIIGGGFSGNVTIEVSGDDINWDQDFKTLSNSNSCDTKDISAKYIRAVGNNGTAAALFIGSENAYDTAPFSDGVVFQENDPEGSRGNIYVTWPETMAALADLESGPKNLYFSAKFGHLRIPPGTASNGATYNATHDQYEWNMDGVVWRDTGTPSAFRNIFVDDGAFIPNLHNIEFQYGAWRIINLSTDITKPVSRIEGEPFYNLSMGRGSGAVISIHQGSADSAPFFLFPPTVANFFIKVGQFFSFGSRKGQANTVTRTAPSPVLEVQGPRFGIAFEGGGAIRNSIKAPAGTIFACQHSQSATSSNYGVEEQQEFLGVYDHTVYEASRLNIQGRFSGTIDVQHNFHLRCATDLAACTINLPLARERLGEVVEVKDQGQNSSTVGREITIVPQSIIETGTMSFLDDDGNGQSEITGFNFRGAKYQPHDLVTFSGTVSNNATYEIASLVGVSGAKLVGVVATTEANVVATATYQEDIDGATSEVINVDGDVRRLRVVDRSSWSIV